MHKLLSILIAAGLVASSAAQASPVSTSFQLSLQVGGLGSITVAGSGTVSVVGSTLMVPVGLVSVTAPIIVPVTSTSTVASLRLAQLGNLAGTFRPGGIASQVPGEVCPGVANHPGGFACNVGGGFGGAMGFTGSLLVTVAPGLVTIPIDLSQAMLGQGGSTNIPFDADAAGWSTGAGQMGTLSGAVSTFVGAASPLTLVTPTFVISGANLLPIIGILSFPSLSIPEPALLLLVGVGAAGIVALARRR